MPVFVYECNSCGFMCQENEKIKCSCGCGGETFECECGGTISLKCECFKGSCHCMDDPDELTDDIDGWWEN